MKYNKNNVYRKHSAEFMYKVYSICLLIGIFIVIFVIFHGNWNENLADFISGIIVCLFSILAPLFAIMYYSNTKYIFYADRFEKYNLFNIKKTYYYKFLEKKVFTIKEKTIVYFYYNGKRAFKFDDNHSGSLILFCMITYPNFRKFPPK